jgi:hypothetical protein
VISALSDANLIAVLIVSVAISLLGFDVNAITVHNRLAIAPFTVCS